MRPLRVFTTPDDYAMQYLFVMNEQKSPVNTVKIINLEFKMF